MLWNIGMTKISRTAMAMAATRHDDARVDHRALHLAHQRVVLLEEDGQAEQDGVQDAAGLARGHHVHVQARERLRMLG